VKIDESLLDEQELPVEKIDVVPDVSIDTQEGIISQMES